MPEVTAGSLNRLFSIEFWFDTVGETPRRTAILTTIAECQETALLQAERILSAHSSYREWGEPDTWFCRDSGVVR